VTDPADRKLYLGPRLRTLRRELGINQTRMAEELGVSPSYLNHLERNQRPLTAQMLLRLANTYDIDVRDFVSGPGPATAGDLSEAFADTLVRDLAVPRHELGELVDAHPQVAEAIGRLYRALTDLRRLPDAIAAPDGPHASGASPVDWLRDYLQQRRNHLAELDIAAEAIAETLPDDPAERQAALRQRLKDVSGISTLIAPETVLSGALRHYDYHRRRLMLAEAMPASARQFALAYQLCLFELDPLLSEQLGKSGAPDAQTRVLAKIALTNYAAAALLMPYDRFRRAAEESRYDLALLQARFGVSFEQAAHRLTTLSRSGARALPFFLVSFDGAGQILKRFLGDAYPFARHGGLCPRWPGLDALGGDGITTSLVESPSGDRFLTFTAPARHHGKGRRAVAIGCDARHAGQIVHADGLTTVTTIGPSCALCERIDCPDRAGPPIARSLELNQFRRPTALWPFLKA
jgi:predicted transcriptional regulator/DNA-binding XRE family transcriptional regulator